MLSTRFKAGDFGHSFVGLRTTDEPCSVVGTMYYAGPEVVNFLGSDWKPRQTPGIDSFSLAATAFSFK